MVNSYSKSLKGKVVKWMSYSDLSNFCQHIKQEISCKIILINNMRIYNTVTEASVDTGVNVNSIINCCDGKYNYGGIDEKNRRMKWIYLKDYIKLYQKCR